LIEQGLSPEMAGEVVSAAGRRVRGAAQSYGLPRLLAGLLLLAMGGVLVYAGIGWLLTLCLIVPGIVLVVRGLNGLLERRGS
jgi:hypothetical protein